LLIVIVYIELRVLKSAFQASVTSIEQNGLLFKLCSPLVPAYTGTHCEQVPTHQSTLFLFVHLVLLFLIVFPLLQELGWCLGNQRIDKGRELCYKYLTHFSGELRNGWVSVSWAWTKSSADV